MSGSNSVRAPRRRASQSTRQRLLRIARRYRSLVFAGGALLLTVAAVLVLANPLGPATAVDATGQTVRAGPIDTPGAAPRVGHEAPNFVLPGYDDQAIRLDDFRGKVVFLNFWATWCTVCEAEMPDMQRLAEQYADDLVVLAVNRGESAGRAQDWSSKRGLQDLVFALDQRESVAGAYKLGSGMPQSFFIDKNGVITRVISGGQSFATMEKNLKEALTSPAQ